MSALARVASIGLEKLIDVTMIRSYLNTLEKRGVEISILSVEMQTPGGLQGVKLLPISTANEVILKYNPRLLMGMADAGHTKFLHHLIDFQIELEVTTPYTHILVGNWGEERHAGIEVRKEFNSLLASTGRYNYDKYTNKCYSALFGCTADTLRKLRTTTGTSRIARNHLPESIEMRAVQMLEQAIIDNYEPNLSITRMIVWFGNLIKAQMHLPHFGTAKKSRSVVWKEMCAYDRQVLFIAATDNAYVLPEGF